MFTSIAYADACTALRAAIDAELAAFAAYQVSRGTDSFAAAGAALLDARDASQRARESVGHVPDENTRAAAFFALEAASVVARTVIDWQGEAAFEAAEDDAAFASWRSLEAVFSSACE